MSKRERKIIVGLFVAIILLVVIAGAMMKTIDDNKYLQQVGRDMDVTIDAMLYELQLTNEAKNQN